MARATCAWVALLALLTAACGGGGGGTTTAPATPPVTTPTTPASVYVAPAAEALSADEVGRIVAQAVAEARARNLPSVISVVDRVGNVLAVFRMAGARETLTTPKAGQGQANVELQGIDIIPAELGAISKAMTAAYLSSSGNAFTTRTASEIVQEHFPPAPNTAGLESGPLFGVQFSQLPCSDLNTRYAAGGGAGAFLGPKRAPLGLAADPGAVPLYKNGVVVGAVGVMGDGVYGFDPDILDVDQDNEEYAALAGSIGFEAPAAIRASEIRLDGTALRFVDATADRLMTQPGASFAAIAAVGMLVSVRGYYAEGATPALLAGTPYGSEASGYRAATAAEFDSLNAFVLTDGQGNNRYPARAGTDAGEVATPLTAAEVRATLEEALVIVSRARAGIRQPLDSRMQATVSIVDTRGAILGIVRSPDAPVFGTDVSLQKARTAAFLSGGYAAGDLSASPDADVRARVQQVRDFLGDQAALTGRTAFSDRSVGNLARPYFPDGEVGRGPGPLSRPIEQFSPFATGLQAQLIRGNIVQHAGYVLGASADTPRNCSALPNAPGAATTRLANGLQIFSGSVPIYRGAVLVGAIGVSGDGIDQDDMAAFLGLHNGGRRAGGIGHAAADLRSDRIVVRLPDGRDVRLRYVNCPFAPFVDTADQNVCQGI